MKNFYLAQRVVKVLAVLIHMFEQQVQPERMAGVGASGFRVGELRGVFVPREFGQNPINPVGVFGFALVELVFQVTGVFLQPVGCVSQNICVADVRLQ